jgi:hypothetical protein
VAYLEGAPDTGDGSVLEGRARDRRPLAILVLALIVCGAFLLVVGRHLSFFADEWTFALDRRAWNFDALLSAHNGHLVLVPALIYKLLFELVGFAHSWPYRLILFLFHAACVLFIYLLARRRFGPWLALFPAGLLLLPGTSSDNMLGAFQIAFLGSMAFGLGALVCLDREERRSDIAASVLVGLSICCSSIGVAFAAGILAELILTREKRPRLYIALIPFALYGLWFIGFHPEGGENTIQAGNIPATPRYDARAAAQGFAGFGNLPIVLGSLLMLVTAIWLGMKLWKERGLPARAFTGIVGGLAFWTLAALARAQIGDASAARYIYPSMVFILIIVIASAPPIRRVSWQVGAVLAAIVCFAVVNDIAPLRSFADDYRAEQDALTKAERSAEFLADREADPWNEAIRDLDYPVLSGAELIAQPPAEQLRADETLTNVDPIEYVAATPLEVEKAEPAPLGATPGLSKGTVTRGDLTCTRVRPEGAEGAVDVRLPADHDLLLLRIGEKELKAGVRLRRLSSRFRLKPIAIPPDSLPEPGTAGIVRIVDDNSNLPWYARVRVSGPVGLCLVPPLD